MNKWVIAAVFLGLLVSPPCPADDGAASIAEGGIVMKREGRITMAKEVLTISETKVTVDYDFRNDTDENITTEVAFPIPDYDLDMGEREWSAEGFDDFRLWVNGSPVHYAVEARALLKGKDYTALLRSMNVDVASFAKSKDNDTQPQIERLSAAQKQQLAEAGLIDKVQGTYAGANWTVRKKYYWSQTFLHMRLFTSATYTRRFWATATRSLTVRSLRLATRIRTITS